MHFPRWVTKKLIADLVSGSLAPKQPNWVSLDRLINGMKWKRTKKKRLAKQCMKRNIIELMTQKLCSWGRQEASCAKKIKNSKQLTHQRRREGDERNPNCRKAKQMGFYGLAYIIKVEHCEYISETDGRIELLLKPPLVLFHYAFFFALKGNSTHFYDAHDGD